MVHLTSGDWCYVEDRDSTKGYVPSSYLKLYSLVQASHVAKANGEASPEDPPQ